MLEDRLFCRALEASRRLGSPVVVRRLFRLDDADPWAALGEKPGRPSFAWHEPAFELLALGELAPLTCHELTSWSDHRRWLAERLVTAGDDPWPLAVGGRSFDGEPGVGEWQGWPGCQLVVPELIFVRRADELWCVAHTLVSAADEELGVPTIPGLDGPEPVERAEALASPPAFVPCEDHRRWQAAMDDALTQIETSALDKVVLSRRSRCELADDEPRLAAAATLRRLRATYPELTCYGVAPAGHATALVGATPETLVEVGPGGQVKAMALAGTRASAAEAGELLADDKERREHDWVVQAIDEALAPVCANLERGPTQVSAAGAVHHLQTNFRGELANGQDVLGLVERLHPTPAVGGWPRAEAVALLARLEQRSRGWYAAPVGWLNAAGEGRFVVALRGGLVAPDRAWAFAGAGVVAGSTAEGEWRETEAKMDAFCGCLAREPAEDHG